MHSQESESAIQRLAAPRIRIAGIEWLRFVASMAIVWFHAGAPGRAISYAGLPIFMALSCAFAFSPSTGTPVQKILSRRASRFMLPWLFWSLVYLVIQIPGLHHVTLSWRDFGSMLLIGGYIHLWYLPYAFVITSIVEWYSPIFADATRLTLTVFFISATFGCILISGYILHICGPIRIPFQQWIFTFPAVPLGMACAPLFNLRWPMRLTLLGVIPITWIAYYFIPVCLLGALITPYCIAILMIAMALLMISPASTWGTEAGRCSFGIYIIHPMILATVVRVVHTPSAAFTASLTIILTVLAVAGIRRTPLTKFL